MPKPLLPLVPSSDDPLVGDFLPGLGEPALRQVLGYPRDQPREWYVSHVFGEVVPASPRPGPPVYVSEDAKRAIKVARIRVAPLGLRAYADLSWESPGELRVDMRQLQTMAAQDDLSRIWRGVKFVLGLVGAGGRTKGSITKHLSVKKVYRAYRELMKYHRDGTHPTQTELAVKLGVSVSRLTRFLREMHLDWPLP